MLSPEDSRQYLGLIAEDTSDISECFVTFGPDRVYDEEGQTIDTESGPLLNSDQLVPVDINDRAVVAALINSIQELKEENVQLKLRIDALEID